MKQSEQEPVALSQAHLPALSGTAGNKRTRVATASVPFYHRHLEWQRVPNRIAHIGVGGFHRAHMALYTHELLNTRASANECGLSPSWCIVGVGITPGDMAMFQALSAQDFLYCLVECMGNEERCSIIGSLFGMVVSNADAAGTSRCVEVLSERETKIISLTVTPAGYAVTTSAMQLNVEDPKVAADVRAVVLARGTTTPCSPSSTVGVLVEALRVRRARGAGGVTILSCDNIQHNGQVVQTAVLSFAAWQEREGGEQGLAAWIERECTFPSTMVDRITPVTTPKDKEWVRKTYGVVDQWPIVSERFRQWVIEDRFVGGVRPEWDKLEGVQFTADVAPYETMKLRLLNGSHLAVACLGDLRGLTFIDETMGWAPLQAFMRALMRREVMPTVPPVKGVDLNAYQETLVARFGNVAIKDQVLRVATDAPIAVILDTLRDHLASAGGGSRELPLLALVVAAWLRRARGGVDEAGRSIRVVHPLAAKLHELGSANPLDPRPQMRITEIFGNLATEESMVIQVEKYLRLLNQKGVAAAIDDALSASARSQKQSGGAKL